MSDTIDQMNERNALIEAAQLASIRAKAKIQPGKPGDCDLCGEWSARLVKGACAPCRDRYRLP